MEETHDAFRALFDPQAVAVIGASGNPLKMGHQCLLSLREGNFPGAIFPVHPREKEILGMPVFSSLKQVPGRVDLAILVVPAGEALSALRACGEKGVGGAVVITAGFGEIDDLGGKHLQEEMATVANERGIKIIGPNTFGMANLHARLNASFTPIFSRLKPGPISVISQSGGVAHLVAYQALDEGVGLGKVIGLGNRCNVEFADLLPYFLHDKETGCLILFIEGLDDPRPLLRGVRRVCPGKPVVAMKAGRYPAAARAARSHTGSLAGKSEFYEAALRQAGALVVHEPQELLDVAKILSLAPPAKGGRVAVVSFQAGPGILLTDAVASQGLHMAVFEAGTQEKLNRLLPPLTIRMNPVDMAFARDEKAFAESTRAILQDGNVDALVIFLLHHPFMTPRRIAPFLTVLRKEFAKPLLLCVNSPRGFIEEEVQELEAQGIPVYPLPRRAIRALKGLVEYGARHGRGDGEGGNKQVM